MEKGKLIGQGRTAEVFEWGNDKILKLFRENFPKAAIEKEYDVSLKISKKMNFAPKVYEIVEIDKRCGIVYERIDGSTMMKAIALRPLTVKKEARRLADLHKAIQQKVHYDFPDYKVILKDNITKTELLEESIKTKLCKYIDELEDGDMLCHGDFHPDNILMTKDGERIIDWMTAAKGNPLADIARTSILFKFGVIPEKNFFEKCVINFVRNKFYLEYLKHYMRITGVRIEQIEKWELPIAAARLNEWLPKEEKDGILNFINSTIKNIM